MTQPFTQSECAYIGADVGGTNIRFAAMDSFGKPLIEVREPTPAHEGPKNMLDLLAKLYNQVSQQLNAEKINFLPALGVGWPGPVDRNRGIVFETHNISGFDNFKFTENLKNIIGVPVYLENDAKCAGLAEKNFGVGQEFQDFVYLTFGTGIGGVVYSKGKIQYGSQGLAGEIGHMTLYPKGELCTCGNHGCFERYGSAKALERRYFSATGKELSAKEILLSYENSHESISKLMELYIDDLSIGIGSLITILNPQAIVFAGGLFKSGGGKILPAVKKKLETQGFHSMKSNVKLLSSPLHGKAGVLGAASLTRVGFDQATQLK